MSIRLADAFAARQDCPDYVTLMPYDVLGTPLEELDFFTDDLPELVALLISFIDLLPELEITPEGF